tara:strand:+ start:230 stop:613 length:384 start_codon:yes stop_codon:yes gene_type:complete
MDPRSREIASSNNPFGILGPTFNTLRKETPYIDQGQEFLLNFIRGNRNNPTGTGNTGVSPEKDSQVLQRVTKGLDKINKAGINIGTSGVGINRQINPGGILSGEVFANQPYQGQFNYGGAVNFKIPF